MKLFIYEYEIKIDEMRDNAIERMRKISVMLRGEDASQPMMVQSIPIENNLCNFDIKIIYM